MLRLAQGHTVTPELGWEPRILAVRIISHHLVASDTSPRPRRPRLLLQKMGFLTVMLFGVFVVPAPCR